MLRLPKNVLNLSGAQNCWETYWKLWSACSQIAATIFDLAVTVKVFAVIFVNFFCLPRWVSHLHVAITSDVGINLLYLPQFFVQGFFNSSLNRHAHFSYSCFWTRDHNHIVIIWLSCYMYSSAYARWFTEQLSETRDIGTPLFPWLCSKIASSDLSVVLHWYQLLDRFVKYTAGHHNGK